LLRLTSAKTRTMNVNKLYVNYGKSRYGETTYSYRIELADSSLTSIPISREISAQLYSDLHLGDAVPVQWVPNWPIAAQIGNKPYLGGTNLRLGSFVLVIGLVIYYVTRRPRRKWGRYLAG
jgi:hypothetical protein